MGWEVSRLVHRWPWGSQPRLIAIGDFNKDGKADFAVANNGSNDVSIRLGDGLGGFSGSTTVPAGTGPFSVAIADFNLDGNSDLAIANNGSTDVSIRIGDGLGGFLRKHCGHRGDGPVSNRHWRFQRRWQAGSRRIKLQFRRCQHPVRRWLRRFYRHYYNPARCKSKFRFDRRFQR